MTKGSISNQWEKNETFNVFGKSEKTDKKRIKLDPSFQLYTSLQLGQRLKRLGTTKRKESIQALEKPRQSQPGRIGNSVAMAENQEAMQEGMKAMKHISFPFSSNIRKTTCTKQPFCMASAPPASLVLILAATEVTSLAQALTYLPCPRSGRCHGLWENSPQ